MYRYGHLFTASDYKLNEAFHVAYTARDSYVEY